MIKKKKIKTTLEKKVDQLQLDHTEFMEFLRDNAATKEDLKNFATKEDLKNGLESLEHKMDARFDYIINILEDIVKNQKINTAEHRVFKAQINRIEDKVFN